MKRMFSNSSMINLIHKNFQFFNKKQKLDLLIIDDFLPSQLSPWRNFEFDELLKAIPNSSLVCDLNIFEFFNQGKTFEENLFELKEGYPVLSAKCKKLKLFQNSNVGLVYILFYHNLNRYFAHFERHKIPFAFTLYPGGDFVLGNIQINNRLKQICNSPYFRGVIVNQPILQNYLLDNNIVEVDKLKLISGVPIKIDKYVCLGLDSAKFENPTVEIAFIANKYMIQGFDKGFDLFQMIANQLLNWVEDIQFHIIGSFSQNDLIFQRLKGHFIFHGQLVESKLGEVFSRTQICISPNRMGVLKEGAFDGFPLASSVTAGLYNNLLLLSDPLDQSQKIGLVDGEDFIKIPIDLFYIDKVLNELIHDRNKMKQIALSGKRKLQQIYSFEKQITPRIEFIKSILLKHDPGN